MSYMINQMPKLDNIRPKAREAIIEAAFQMFSRNRSATLAEIALKAGVGRATLHRHFPGRDALMVALAQTAMAELDAAVEQAVLAAMSHAEGLRLAFEAIVPLAERQGFLALEPLDSEPELQEAYNQSRNELIDSIREAQREGALNQDLPEEWIAEAYDHLIYAAWAMVRDGEATPKHATELGWRTFMGGVAAPV